MAAVSRLGFGGMPRGGPFGIPADYSGKVVVIVSGGSITNLVLISHITDLQLD